MTTTQELCERLRERGWSVAIHNDYRQGDERFTFWLFTHQNGAWVKGEGRTDEEALMQANKAAAALTAQTERIAKLEAALAQGARWFEEYAIEHYAKADTAPSYAKEHSREVKGKLNQERADFLRAALKGADDAQG